MSNYIICKFRGKWRIENIHSGLVYTSRLYKYKLLALIHKFILDMKERIL